TEKATSSNEATKRWMGHLRTLHVACFGKKLSQTFNKDPLPRLETSSSLTNKGNTTICSSSASSKVALAIHSQPSSIRNQNIPNPGRSANQPGQRSGTGPTTSPIKYRFRRS
ncbi:MAG TPA: hypothetical protein PKE58_24015, partial [Acidobacteriota bacterium]|nr:hypothetical protein [Acidobacteriota bacterium]